MLNSVSFLKNPGGSLEDIGCTPDPGGSQEDKSIQCRNFLTPTFFVIFVFLFFNSLMESRTLPDNIVLTCNTLTAHQSYRVSAAWDSHIKEYRNMLQ